MPPKPRRRRDANDDYEEDDLARRIRKRRSKGFPPWAILAILVGGLVLLIPVILLLNLARNLAPGPDDPDPNKLRLGHVAGDMFTFNSPAKISQKFGPGRTLSRDEIERTILEERDIHGTTVSRKSVRDWIARNPAEYTYHHWAIEKEDLYVAFPNVRNFTASSRAACWSRYGKQWYIMMGGDSVDPKG